MSVAQNHSPLPELSRTSRQGDLQHLCAPSTNTCNQGVLAPEHIARPGILLCLPLVDTYSNMLPEDVILKADSKKQIQ